MISNKHVTFSLYLALCAFALGLCANACAATITTFSAPDSGLAENLGTRAMSINQAGVVAGWYDNEKGAFGFVRATDGTITEFDADGTHNTYAVAINDAGTIAGYAGNSGFVRAAGGTVTLFSSPAGEKYPTLGLGINDAGAVTGYWLDSHKVAHGFVRAADGTFTSFDAPGAGSGANLGEGTYAVGINASGVITGYLSGTINGTSGTFGFLRASNGTSTIFAVNPSTVPLGINSDGEVTGYWQDNNGLNHGFVRAADGTLTTFSGNDVDISSISYSINAAGATTGYINGAGFIRMPGGTVYPFHVAGNGPIPVSINQSYSVTGYYAVSTSTAFAWHGFVLTQ